MFHKQKAKDMVFTKQPYLEDVGPRRIKGIRLAVMSGPEIMRAAECQVHLGQYYDSNRKPIPGGLLDTRMGPANKSSSCGTCGASFRQSEIERELAEVTFEDLLKARSNGSHALYIKPTQENRTARANKNRPMETSCKKPVSRFREVVQLPKKMVRDPRFESLCGELNVEGFRKRYNFLYEDDLPAEKEELKKQLKKSKDPGVIDQLKNRISWIDRQLKFNSTKNTDATILAEHKKKEREAVKQGKQPFYLKKSEIRKQRLFEKFNKLKESGKLDSFIEKRRKKNASKDRRFMPYRRPDNSRQGS